MNYDNHIHIHIHKATNYKPVEIRDTTDKQIIEEVNNNNQNYCNKKIDESYENLLKEGDYLIINDNINYVIPGIFYNYLKKGNIEI